MYEIRVYPKGAESSAVKIWPEGEVIPEGLIKETGRYVIEARGADASGLDLLVDDLPLEALKSRSSNVGMWSWEPGYYAGAIEAALYRNGKAAWQGRITLDPDRAKLSRIQFDQMVSEVLADTFAIFSVSSARKGIGRGPAGQVPPIARLEFLRSRFQDIEAVVRKINDNPVRHLKHSRQRIRPGGRAPVGTLDLVLSFQKGTLGAVPPTSPLFRLHDGMFPRVLHVSTRRVDLDTQEHRAIKTELRRWMGWLNVVAGNIESDLLSGEDKQQQDLLKGWVKRCRAMSNRIRRLLALPLFEDVSEISTAMTVTAVFRWASSYRKYFRLSADFRAGLARVAGDFLNMPLSRTYDIYELWAYLRLIRAATEIFGTKEFDASALFTLDATNRGVKIPAAAVMVRLNGALTLGFQRSYQEYWLSRPPTTPGSFTRRMIPDISIEIEDAETPERMVIVFDAKYRVDQQINDAVSSLHMYRDAIVQDATGEGNPMRIVKAAYLLTPDLPSEDITSGTSPWKEHRLPGLLFHPAYRKDFLFGALTLRPGMTDAEIRTAFARVLDDVGVGRP